MGETRVTDVAVIGMNCGVCGRAMWRQAAFLDGIGWLDRSSFTHSLDH